MVCDKCGTPCQGTLCRECEQIRANEKRHGTTVPEPDQWAIDQQGLGDADAAGQSTLDGGIRPDGGADG